MFTTLTGIVGALVMLGVLVVIHEFGHYVMARIFKVDTPVFSIGMGPRLFGFRAWDTDFRVSVLPVGGFVRMAGADPFDEVDDPVSEGDDSGHFMKKPVWQRLLILLAGPLANLVLPVFLFTSVLMLGEPQPDATVGTVLADTPAQQAGFASGDTISSVQGHPVVAWADFVSLVRDLPDDQTAHISVTRAGEPVMLEMPAGVFEDRSLGLVDVRRAGLAHGKRSARVGVTDASSPAWQAGIRPGDLILEMDGEPVRTRADLADALAMGNRHEGRVARIVNGERTVLPFEMRRDGGEVTGPGPESWGLQKADLVIERVLDDSAAEAAGVMAGDHIAAIDGQAVRSWSDVLERVGATVGETTDEDTKARPLSLTVVRQGEPMSLVLVPKLKREVWLGKVRYRPLMGVRQASALFLPGPTVRQYYAFHLALPRAVRESRLVLTSTLDVLGGLVTGQLAPKESIGGPVEIMRAAGASAQDGLYTFARMMGMISFSLGIVNLLPIPALDGGQIVLLGLEAIRGRPLSVVLRERIQMIGVLALAAIMVMVTVMDVSRWLGG